MMPEQELSENDKLFLLSLARKTISNYVNNLPLPEIDKNALSSILNQEGACFVTLTEQGYLRGCVGALEPYQSLVNDVVEHAIAAAFQDFRFPPLQRSELDQISIEISVLTKPKMLNYQDPDNLLEQLRPNVDGVVLRDGMRRSTFLPQVWEKIPDKVDFLEELCMKMGASPDLWKKKKIEVLTYQVIEFHE